MAAHAVRDHQEAATAQCRYDDGRAHVAGQDTGIESDGVLIRRPHLKKRGFLRILDVEERHLSTCEKLIAELRAALTADERLETFKAAR